MNILEERKRKRDNERGTEELKEIRKDYSYRTNYVEGLLPVHIGGYDERMPGVGGVVHSKVRQLQEALLSRHRLGSRPQFCRSIYLNKKIPFGTPCFF